MDIKVSVIVPVYNTSEYLSHCLDSLINQTLEEIEIICVNDGSTDYSADIIGQYKAKCKKIKLINQTHKGVSKARNTGIAEAKGQYIGFVDSDDFAHPGMFEKLYNNAQKFDSDIVMCPVAIYDNKTKKTSFDDPYFSLGIFPESYTRKVFNYNDCRDFLFRICVAAWNKIYKKTFVEKNSLAFIEGVIFEDNPFCVESLIKAQKITLVNEALIYYRRETGTSIISGNDDEKKLNIFEVFDNIEKILIENGIYNEYKNYFTFHKKRTLLYWYEKIKNKRVKMKYLALLLLAYPDFLFNTASNKFADKNKERKIKKIVSGKKVLIWGRDGYTLHFAQKLQYDNFLGFVQTCNNDNVPNVYKIDEISALDADMILAISKTYYNYDKIIRSILSEQGIDIPVVKI